MSSQISSLKVPRLVLEYVTSRTFILSVCDPHVNWTIVETRTKDEVHMHDLHFTHRITAHNKHVLSLDLIQPSTSMKIGEQSNSISLSKSVHCTNLHQIIVLLVYTRLYSMYNYNWHNKARTERTTCLHDIAWTAKLRIFPATLHV